MIDNSDTVDARPNGEAPPSGVTESVVVTAVRALTQASQTLTAAATQMMQTVQGLPDGTSAEGIAQFPAGGVLPAASSVPQINTWEDDPFSEATPTMDPVSPDPVVVDVTTINAPLLRFAIRDPQPLPARYPPGTPDFRYWVAAEALTRGINFWMPLLPTGTRWSAASSPLPVNLVVGQLLNAQYRRFDGLRFFQNTVNSIPVYSGESPDVVCHELGHAILDALRPELWNAASFEQAAFHEAFGDLSSILCALQLQSYRQKILDETQGRLTVTSRLSRAAEQLGWALRQIHPDSVDPDSLRNAANSFFYEPPEQLPTFAPFSALSSEPHSFARVFTGAFLDVLGAMLTISGAANDANLLTVSRALGQLLIDGIRTAPLTPAYFGQVAAAMIQADRARNGGQYGNALSIAFVQRGILSPASITSLANAPVPHFEPAPGAPADDVAAMTGYGDVSDLGGTQMLITYDGGTDDGSYRHGFEDAPDLPTRPIPDEFGLGEQLLVHVPTNQDAFAVAPAAPGIGSVETIPPEQAARHFVEGLVRQGRVDLGPAAGVAATNLSSIEGATHELEDVPGGKVLRRLYFDCGLCQSR
jgi:hypothetical protein